MKQTIAETWCSIYTSITTKEIKKAQIDPVTGKKPTRPYHAFINLSGLIKYPKMLQSPMEYVFINNGTPTIIDIDGFPNFRCKPKFVEAIRRCGNDYKGIVYMLKTFFRPQAIALLWPDIVLGARNMEARKQQRREFQLHREMLKKVPAQDRQLHVEVSSVTRNKSVASFARERRGLTL